MRPSFSLDVVHVVLLVDVIGLRIDHDCSSVGFNEDCSGFTESGASGETAISYIGTVYMGCLVLHMGSVELAFFEIRDLGPWKSRTRLTLIRRRWGDQSNVNTPPLPPLVARRAVATDNCPVNGFGIQLR
jgi:hypothetical protein